MKLHTLYLIKDGHLCDSAYFCLFTESVPNSFNEL